MKVCRYETLSDEWVFEVSDVVPPEGYLRPLEDLCSVAGDCMQRYYFSIMKEVMNALFDNDFEVPKR